MEQIKQNTIINGLALDLNKPNETTSVEIMNEDDFKSFMNLHKEELKKDPAVLSLTSKIDATEPKSILSFGKESSKDIASISDKLLNSIKAVKENESNELLNQLTKIMKKIDVKEISNKDKGFINKLFNKARKTVEDLIAKYESISDEVEGVYITLNRYQKEIMDETEKLSLLYKGNMQYFRELEKYVVAGELVIEELDNKIIPQYEEYAKSSSDPLAIENTEMLRQCREMVSQRVYDLKLAENLSLQSMPMIQQIQRGNFELLKTIESSFIVTLPALKNCIIQAIVLKKQENRAKNVQDLKDFTNDLIIQNANNSSKQAVQLAKMGGTGIIDIEKLEESFNIIQQGIKDAKQQEEENKIYRLEGERKLEQMKLTALSKNLISE